MRLKLVKGSPPNSSMANRSLCGSPLYDAYSFFSISRAVSNDIFLFDLCFSKQYKQFRLQECVIINVHTRVVLIVWLLDNEFSMIFRLLCFFIYMQRNGIIYNECDLRREYNSRKRDYFSQSLRSV